jgi:hypothetical protein
MTSGLHGTRFFDRSPEDSNSGLACDQPEPYGDRMIRVNYCIPGNRLCAERRGVRHYLGSRHHVGQMHAVRDMTTCSGVRPRSMGDRKPLLVIVMLSGLALAACGGSSSPSAQGSTATSQPRIPRTAKPLNTTTTTPPAPAPLSTAPARGCFPRTQKGTCFAAGDACPAADHGRTGQAADGAAIACRHNHGWRWEPA